MKKQIVIEWVFGGKKGGSGKTTMLLTVADSLKFILDHKVKIVDKDPQASIYNAVDAKLSSRHFSDIDSEQEDHYVLYDLPPYNDSSMNTILAKSHLIIVPVKLSYADLLAAKQNYDDLRRKGFLDKTCIVFNEIRKPHNSAYRELKGLFLKHFQDVYIAQTEISNLLAYRMILKNKIEGKAKIEAKMLIDELIVRTQNVHKTNNK